MFMEQQFQILDMTDEHLFANATFVGRSTRVGFLTAALISDFISRLIVIRY
jgi:hypothetical protein